MGIKHFFQWYLRTQAESVQTLPVDAPVPVPIDTLALDLNGIFHPAAQKIFQYGKHEQKRLLPQRSYTLSTEQLWQRVFKEVCLQIDTLVTCVRPRKRLLLCVDGVAGLAKMQQQRSRRFKSVDTNSSCAFDSNSITPGTEFMHRLNLYIERHARKQRQGDWNHLDVLFSSEKVPGEGEAKCFAYMRDTFTDPNESFCIYGLDADLIMLCLALNRPNVYVYRDNVYDPKTRYLLQIDKLGETLRTTMGTNCAVIDFVFICFMVGNDFLPQIPGLEIFNGGIEMLLDIYSQVCRPFGLLHPSDKRIRIPTLLRFMDALAVVEKEALKEKYRNRHRYFEDPLMDKHFSIDKSCLENGTPTVKCNFEKYKEEYYRTKLPTADIETVCRDYIRGLQWVIQYYTQGIPSWSWFFPYSYAPFLDDLARCTTYCYKEFSPSSPYPAFQQLLAVLPPQSHSLLPDPLAQLMDNPRSPLIDYYPATFDIDISGKRAEWEGIVVLPLMDFKLLKNVYQQTLRYVSREDCRRNQKHHAVYI